MTDFLSYTKANQQLVAKYLEQFFAGKRRRKQGHLIFQTDALNRLAVLSQKGKMLRGVFCLLSYELNAGTNNSLMLPVAAAIEIMNTALLIHDDIMDNDVLRRGMKTMYAQYMAFAEQKDSKNSEDYGKSMALCVGDLAFFLAFELITSAESPKDRISRAVALMASELQYVGYAQMQDFDFGQTDYEPTKDEIFSIYQYKTARYTFSLPFMLGALFAGADETVIHQFATIGEKLGIIFQIKDDELGLFGTEDIIGKVVGSDIRENKKTIYRLLIFEKATSKEKLQLAKAFGNQNLTLKQIDFVKATIQKYKIQEIVNKEMSSIAKEIADAIDKLKIEPARKAILQQLVDFNTGRLK